VSADAIIAAQRLTQKKKKEFCPPHLPDPMLVALRASVARVANLSGAAEQQNQIMRERDEIQVLSGDTTLNVLDSLLSRLV
jgi:hypothetical protein